MLPAETALRVLAEHRGAAFMLADTAFLVGCGFASYWGAGCLEHCSSFSIPRQSSNLPYLAIQTRPTTM